MDFALNDEQEQLQQSARKYLDSLGGVKLARRYGDKRENAALDQVWQGIANLGYGGILIPEEYGGLGLGMVSLVPVMEELGRYVTPGAFPETFAFAAHLISRAGSEEQKQEILAKIIDGSARFALGLTEAGTYSVPDEIRITAEREGDKFVLSGTKTFAWEADSATHFIIVARTRNGSGLEGLSAFLVPAGTAGLNVRERGSLDLSRRLFELELNHLVLGPETLIGGEGVAGPFINEAVQFLTAAIISEMVGAMDELVILSTNYAKTREQFGQPIGRFQGVKHRIADMQVKKEMARSLSYYAAWALEAGAPDAASAVAAAKSFAGEAFIQLASDNIQNHGGMGFTWEVDAHFYLKRAKAWETYLGSPRTQREKLAVALGW